MACFGIFERRAQTILAVVKESTSENDYERGILEGEKRAALFVLKGGENEGV